MRAILIVAATLLLSGLFSGCQIMRNGFTGSRLSRMLPTTGTAEPGTDGSSDPWIQQAAQEGRREYGTEKVNDPLGLRKFYMSDRAREIERNCGVVE